MTSMMPKHICIVTSWFPDFTHPNKTKFVYNFAQNLSKHNVRVSVITTKSKQDKSISQDGLVTIHRIGRLSLISLFFLLRRIKPDIVNIHAPNLFSSWAVPFSKLLKIPIIGTLHRSEIDSTNRFVSCLRKYILSKFNLLVAVSEYTQRLALLAGVDSKKIIVVYNSVDESIFFPQDKNYCRMRLNLPPDRKILLFVGNLIKLKGPDILLKAMKIVLEIHPDTLLLMVGTGSDHQDLVELCKKHHLDKSTTFIGSLDQSKLSAYYNAADVFILPSRIEGNSVALLEAMASGLVIIASNAGGNTESIQNGQNGLLFDTGNELSLAQKIILSLSDETLCANLSRNSRVAYKSKFSTQIQMTKFHELIQSLSNRTNFKKKILLLDSQGISHYTSYLAKGLSESHFVKVYLFSTREVISTGIDKIPSIEIKSLNPVVKSKSIMKILIIKPLYLFLLFGKILLFSRYDIVHIQGHIPTIFLYLPFVRLTKRIIFWTLHDAVLRPSSEGFRGRMELIYLNLLSQPKILARLSNIITVHGNYIKNQLSSYANPKKITVIPHFDYDYLLTNNDSCSSFLPSDGYALLFGNIRPYKGIPLLVRASRRLKEKLPHTILIAGKGDLAYVKSLLSSEDSQIHIRIEFIDDSKLASLFKNASFVVIPYTEASQSGVIPLAYTFSKAVITSNAGALPEAVENGVTGYVFNVGDERELAYFMGDLFLNKSKSEQMGHNARKKLSTEMSLKKYCDTLNDLYHRF